MDPGDRVRVPRADHGATASGAVRRGDPGGRMSQALGEFWRWRRRNNVLAIVALALVALFPAFVDPLDSKLDFAIYAVAYVMFALGVNIVVGFAGLLDLGYVAFYAFGSD